MITQSLILVLQLLLNQSLINQSLIQVLRLLSYQAVILYQRGTMIDQLRVAQIPVVGVSSVSRDLLY